jgi:HlyD family secretion protein
MLDHLRALLLGFLAMFGGASAPSYQGYGEGDYVLVAPQIGGAIETLDVARGQKVHKGDALFELEHASEQAAVDQAEAEVAHAEAALADLLKAKRQPELDALLAARDEAAAALRIADITYARDLKQIKIQAISQATLDADHAAEDQADAKLAEANATLETGKLSTGRDDAIRVAQADIASARAALAQAQWKLDQKKLTAPADAFVFDTIYRAGEYVKEGQPVVSLLPPANIRVRFFVPETALPSLSLRQEVSVKAGGQGDPVAAHITYIAPQAEYSPPELYNRDNREKLLFMLEATPDANPERIHPGEPVDVVIDDAHN